MEATPDSWDQAMATILRRIRSDDDIDPILQLTLLSVVMTEAGKGSYGLQVCLADQAKAIDEANLSRNVRWMDPDDVEAKVVRISARSFISKLTIPKSLEQDAKKLRQQLGTHVFKVYQPAGSVVARRRRQMAGTGVAQGQARLRALGPDVEPEMGERGKYATPDHVATINAKSTASVLLEGRLVFVLHEVR